MLVTKIKCASLVLQQAGLVLAWGAILFICQLNFQFLSVATRSVLDFKGGVEVGRDGMGIGCPLLSLWPEFGHRGRHCVCYSILISDRESRVHHQREQKYIDGQLGSSNKCIGKASVVSSQERRHQKINLGDVMCPTARNVSWWAASSATCYGGTAGILARRHHALGLGSCLFGPSVCCCKKR